MLALGMTGISSVGVEASNLDTYRNLLQKKTYTIKYTDITPQPRQQNSDRIPLYGKSSMDTSQSAFLAYRPSQNVVVANGDDRYEEIGFGDFKQCRLIKGKDTYAFVKYNNKGVKEVYGNKKGSVIAGETNIISVATQGYGYGSANMTRYLNALMPNSQKYAGSPVFRYVTSGWLNNGLNYEDYSYRNGNVFEAVRYYFNGYNLVKIAAATYWENDKGVMEATKVILKIDEFSATPEVAYLNLPEGVKDNTKRSKGSEEEK